jgi:hypothetical protein
MSSKNGGSQKHQYSCGSGTTSAPLSKDQKKQEASHENAHSLLMAADADVVRKF